MNSNPMTELDAVNAMLVSIGSHPVNSITPQFDDQNLALKILGDVVREVCAHGFKFNTDRNYKLQPDLDGRIHEPTGALNIDPTDPYLDLTPRYHPDFDHRLLWDAENHTYEINKPVLVNVRWSLEFDELPQSARSYAVAAASRRFQAQVIGDPTADRLAQEDEGRSWLTLVKEQQANTTPNVFRMNPPMNARRNRHWR